MRIVNRSAAIIRAKILYAEWAQGCNDGEPYLTLEEHRTDPTVYLIPEIIEEGDEEHILRQHFGTIFEHELAVWTLEKDSWPPNRDFETFQEWFEVEFHTMVIDLCEGEIGGEIL